MKVLTAARFTYAGVEVGFCECEPGELVMLGESCECECHRYDEEDCGCHLDCRDDGSFVGLDSQRESTTARVEERDLTPADLSAAVRDCLAREGWFGAGLREDLVPVLVEIQVDRLREVSDSFAVGTLVAFSHGVTFEVKASRGRPATPRRQ